MARVRRKASAKKLNLEIVGIAAIGLAVLFGIALAIPEHAGNAGRITAAALRFLFGGAAPLFPVLVALFGGIIFLEINVPRMIAGLGSAALVYFLVIDTAFGAGGPLRGGITGGSIWAALRSLVGEAGGWVVLAVTALALGLWLSNASLKKIIGLAIVALGRIKPPAVPRVKLSLPEGHTSLREAFALPKPAPGNGVRGKTAKPVFDDDTGSDDDEYEESAAAAAPLAVSSVFAPSVPTIVAIEKEPHELEALFDEAEDIDRLAAVVGEYEPADQVAAARTYKLPDLALFDPPQAQVADETNRAHILEDTLGSFGVGAKVTHIERGPSITRYELKPERGVKISKIASLSDDLALALAATSIRIEAPIPGKSAVGIEVPNQTVSIVAIREILEALPNRGVVPPLWMALGKDITGRPVFGDLGKMPHLLVAGATGSGKSVCLNTIIASLLVSATPDQVQMLMIDPKRVELTVYNGIPHLIKDVITDARLAAGALFEMTKEMDSRYERFAKAGVRKIEEYNAKFPEEKLPYVVIIIDELADLMLVAPAKVETTIMRIAQLARATGIHLIVATQRPSVDVITGLIKANIPSRIAFAVSSQVDSRTILDMAGAERLLGRGDMLYLPIDAPKPVRAQGALISGSEVNRLVEFWAKQSRPENLLDVEVVPVSDDDEKNKKDADPLCYDAAKFIIETNFASTAQLQSQFSIGHPRAVRLMKQLEEFKVVGPHEGTKPRKVLIGFAELEVIAPRLGRDEESQPELF
ncbi:MAG TPA: DNA translocase FtsK [Candidatus Baltobacteraceae bacterium]|nr:DNA translocase FtsK [Candidatus Baltobacteraceae bacterium]